MKLEISPMIVTEVNLSENNDEQPKDEHPNSFTMDGSVLFDPESNKVAKLVARAQLVSYGKYEVNVVAEFAIRFETEVSEAEATQEIENARTEATVFPYITSYLSAFIALSGYQRPNIPIVVF
ncbi:hypothetical protein V5074_05275 [Atlantibacter hermannii]|uniref:hypothetical protein n=1 Tax=Atlantibacter hermannii TaxID=565 RepID=UPI003076320E